MKNVHGRSTVISGSGGGAAFDSAFAAAASCALLSTIALPTAAALTFSTSAPMSKFRK